MPPHALAFGCGLLAVIGWFFASMGWARYFNRSDPRDKLAALQELAPVMTFASLMTALAGLVALW